MWVALAVFLSACAGDGSFENRSSLLYRFNDVAAATTVARDDSRTWGAAWQDHDLDGDADLLAGRHWRPAQLFENIGGGFRNINGSSKLLDGGDRHGCAWGEANGDGQPDLYCVQGADKGTGSGPNQLFIQGDDGFENRSERYGVIDEFGRGRTTNWMDFDSDGDLDLFVGNHWRDGFPNQTFRNDGDGFTRVDVGLTLELSTVGSSWNDWDRDGDADLLLHQLEPKPTLAFENMDGHFQKVDLPQVTGKVWNAGAWGDYNGDGWTDLHLVSRTRSLVLKNDRGRFVPQHKMRLNEGRMSVWIDAENDGDLDLYVVQGARSESYQPIEGAQNHGDFLMVRTRGGFIAPLRAMGSQSKSGDGDSVAASDYNRDGRMDVFVTNGYFHANGMHELLTNRSKSANWIGLDLIGTKRNPQGLGARVFTETLTRDFWRQTGDGVNFRSQSETGYVHLGIASNERARLFVIWPDGTRDCFRARADEVVVLQIGSQPCSKN